MATEELPTDPSCTPSSGIPPSTDDGDDDELLLYLYEKSSDSRAKCYDCVSMGELMARMQEVSRVEAPPGSDREALSRSAEQICDRALSIVGPDIAPAAPGSQVVGVVRSCRSQENYFELSDMICVDIDIDDNLASSVDALHYRDSVVSRTSDLSGSVETVELESGERSPLLTTPEEKNASDEMGEQSSSEDFRFSSNGQDESASVVQQPRPTEERQPSPSSIPSSSWSLPSSSAAEADSACTHERDDGDENEKLDENAATSLDDELQGRTCLKDADRPSAARLAKRLYYLDGFRKTDVSPHLSKKSVTPILSSVVVLSLHVFMPPPVGSVALLLGGRVVRRLDLRSVGREFESRPLRYRAQPWASC